MPCIYIRERKIGWVKTRQKDRDKGGEVDVMNVKAVDAFQDFSRRIGLGRHRP